MINYKLVLSYDGTGFFGFQSQPTNVPTIEGELKRAIHRLFKCTATLIPAGRTDAGVHASGQVVLCKMEIHILPNNLLRALNSMLIQAIRVISVDIVDNSFHPRYAAFSREYHYNFTNSQVPVFMQSFVTHFPGKLSFENVQQIKDVFLGTHSFKNFKCKGSFQSSDFKTIYKFDIVEQPVQMFGLTSQTFYSLKIEASGFLYKMMRNIMGSVVEVLRSKRSVQDLQNLLAGTDSFAFQTAPAKGLMLVKVNYRGEEA